MKLALLWLTGLILLLAAYDTIATFMGDRMFRRLYVVTDGRIEKR